MTTTVVEAARSARNPVSAPPRRLPAVLLVTGIAVAALTEAVAGTALSLSRFDMIGDIHATPDEFASLGVGYIAAKLVAFVLAPWIMETLGAQTALRAATVCMTIGCAAAALTTDLDALFALRLLQGMAGGILLVSGQTILFQAFTRSFQPVVQSLFAIGAVVAPATLAPYMQGWLLDRLSWTWIFLSVLPIGLAALALLASSVPGDDPVAPRRRLDWPGIVLFAVAASSMTYVLSEGSRWDWFDAQRICVLILAGAVSLLIFILNQLCTASRDRLLDLSIFRDSGFAFGFVASFAAGFALFGSAYLIPSFAVSILTMTPTEAGRLLLPSTLMFIGTLLLTAFLIRRLTVPPVATVPLGIGCFIAAMWMLSAANGDSGRADLMPAMLVRGAALGFLFLSITLITLSHLKGSALACGVGLFNVGRQTGGLVGVAVLQTLIGHRAVEVRTALAAHIVPGRVEVTERLATLTAALTARGMESGDAAEAAVHMLASDVARQASVNAFETAFLTVALFFVVAAPTLIAAKLVIGRIHAASD